MTKPSNRPVVVGVGLVVLDITVGPDGRTELPRVWAGGTCGNVLAILGQLGWSAKLVARIGTDAAGEVLLRDLAAAHVDTSLVRREPARTPIILHRIRNQPAGGASHSFGWACPRCRTRFPSFRPIQVSVAAELEPQVRDATVFFFDRVSRATLNLASAARNAGTMVVFEPSAKCEPRQFIEAVSLSHVLKYARDRREKLAPLFAQLPRRNELSAEIETRGADGVAFRTSVSRQWTGLRPIDVSGVRDTSGAGDWVTAGMLHSLFTGGSLGGTAISRAAMESALGVGQSLAAHNCLFEGPRGSMYAADVAQESPAFVKVSLRSPFRRKREPVRMALPQLCSACAAGDSGAEARAR